MEEVEYPCEFLTTEPCGEESTIIEYDHDEDAYLMLCLKGHHWWYETDDEVWK